MIVSQLVDQANISRNILKRFLKTFDFRVYLYVDSTTAKIVDIPLHREAPIPLITLFERQTSGLKTFQKDYFRKKTAVDISRTINVTIDDVLKILSHEELDFTIYGENCSFYSKEIQPMDVITHISSYHVLKLIQEDQLKQLLLSHQDK
ncbi:hypothetical protein SAMN05192588_1604 [Nonlabens sp. Hel1_33_55]|uniref:hypothetical protein n=1 Tax=Nonlabens sp. Hel1_33_55 TaxID=1336802 RepID=UPI000875EAA4|nr:hypothetical protein [Nonlabens sp. Hel1_33_55]SCY19394.1 hypothetical protein SAMN05192588_1604 [Nonlabens sp. Hel1_33_55]